MYRGADKSLARPGRKQAQKRIWDVRDFNNIETRAVIKVFFPSRQGAEGNSRHSDETLACFFPGRAKDLSAPLYIYFRTLSHLFLLLRSSNSPHHCVRRRSLSLFLSV